MTSQQSLILKLQLHYDLQQAQANWREIPDQYPAMPSASGRNQPQLANQIQPGIMSPPFQTGSDAAKYAPMQGSGEGGEGSMTRSTSGMWQPLDPSQRRMLSRGLSGESAVPEPGDWDPLYRSAAPILFLQIVAQLTASSTDQDIVYFF